MGEENTSLITQDSLSNEHQIIASKATLSELGPVTRALPDIADGNLLVIRPSDLTNGDLEAFKAASVEEIAKILSTHLNEQGIENLKQSDLDLYAQVIKEHNTGDVFIGAQYNYADNETPQYLGQPVKGIIFAGERAIAQEIAVLQTDHRHLTLKDDVEYDARAHTNIALIHEAAHIKAHDRVLTELSSEALADRTTYDTIADLQQNHPEIKLSDQSVRLYQDTRILATLYKPAINVDPNLPATVDNIYGHDTGIMAQQLKFTGNLNDEQINELSQLNYETIFILNNELFSLLGASLQPSLREALKTRPENEQEAFETIDNFYEENIGKRYNHGVMSSLLGNLMNEHEIIPDAAFAIQDFINRIEQPNAFGSHSPDYMMQGWIATMYKPELHYAMTKALSETGVLNYNEVYADYLNSFVQAYERNFEISPKTTEIAASLKTQIIDILGEPTATEQQTAPENETPKTAVQPLIPQ